MFVPGVSAIDEVRRIVHAIAPVPLNVMPVPGLPSREELLAAGARRLSAGIALSLEAYANTARMAAGFMGKAEPSAVSYPMLNALLTK